MRSLTPDVEHPPTPAYGVLGKKMELKEVRMETLELCTSPDPVSYTHLTLPTIQL